MKWRSGVLFLFLVGPFVLYAKIEPVERIAIQAELDQAFTLSLQNGQTLVGRVNEVSEDEIRLSISEGAGEIVYTQRLAEIASIEIPGETYKTLALDWIQEGRESEALELMELLYHQRTTLLPILPASESHFFVPYVELILDSPKPSRAIGVASRIAPQLESEAARMALDDLILESYHRFEMHEQAAELAETWVISRDPHGATAIGFYVWGMEHFRNERYRLALEQALHPIVFPSPVAPEWLAHCYALAIGSALKIREKDYAITLFEEMQVRGLLWPNEEPQLKEILDLFNEKTNTPVLDRLELSIPDFP